MEGGDEMDPCECIEVFNHQTSMQRLLSLLRNSQSYCVDTECFNENLEVENSNPQSQFWTFMICWICIAFLLYFLRATPRDSCPKSHRNNNNNDDHDLVH